MASTITRTSRRSEGLTTRPSTRSNVAISPSNHNIRLQQSNIGRKKRPRDAIDDEEQALKAKKAKMAVEFNARPQLQPKTRSLLIKRDAQPATAPVRNPPTSPPPQAAAPPPKIEIATQTQTKKAPTPPVRKPVDHHQKVANGIKHELDRLQPNAADLKDEKRKLRSQEGARFKSELSAYFPEYDEVIGNEPKEELILNVDTPISIIDSAKIPTKQTSPRKPNAPQKFPLKEYPSSIFHDVRNVERMDYSFMFKTYKEDGGEDPLPSEYFEAMHKRPERQEKGIRNNDKGRAKHERDQVVRLFEGLQGHDWLKLMGVNGVTDSKKKEYEPARDHFIKGCEAILAKFQIWKDEEKRRKMERDAAQAEARAESEQIDIDDGAESDGDPPDYSDIDASAARQLHEEATARSTPVARPPPRRNRATTGTIVVLADEEPQKEFTSFFAKPHMRASALGKHRRSHRSVAAWGHPIPEIPEADFELPEEFRDEETLKAHARRKRRDRRISKS